MPEPSTANYERYVSESDTDGEGDASGGLHRSMPGATKGSMEKDLSFAEGEKWGGSEAVRHEGSLFTRLAASWRGSTKKKLTGKTESRGGNRRHSNGSGRFGSSGQTDGGTLWKDIREGSPRGGGEGLSSGDRCDVCFHRHVVATASFAVLCLL